jgi:flagellar motor switch protein FliM
MEERTSARAEMVGIDFRNPDRLNHAQLGAIRFVQDILVRSLSASLSSLLRAPIQVGMKDMDQLGFQKRAASAGGRAVYASVSISPGRGKALIEIPFPLAVPLLEMLLGATPRLGSVVKSALTEVEVRLFETILRTIVQDWKECWSQLFSIDLHLLSIETRQEFLEVFYQGETVIRSSLEVQSGEIREEMNLLLPALLLKEMLHEQQSKKPPADQDSSCRPDQVLRIIQGAPIRLEVRNLGRQLRLRELLSLQKDDVIILSGDPSEATICVNGVPHWNGRLRSEKNRRSVCIEQSLDLKPDGDVLEVR